MVKLDSGDGTLSFEMKGKNYGVAYKDKTFCSGEYYPAVACLEGGVIEIVDSRVLPSAIKLAFDPNRKAPLINLENENKKAINASRGSSFNTVLTN